MTTLVAFSINLFLGLLVLFGLWGLGKLISGLWSRGQPSIVSQLAIGLAIVLAALLTVGLIRIPFVWGFLVLAVIALGAFLIRLVRPSRRSAVPEKKFGAWHDILTLGVASFVGSLATLGLTRLVGLSHSVVGASSFMNNDEPNYLLTVRAMLQTGLGNINEALWPISNIDYSQFGLRATPGTNLFLILFSPVQSLVGIFTVAAIATAVAIQWLSLLEIVGFVRSKLPRPRFDYFGWLVAGGATLSGLSIYIVGNFFMAQTLGMAAMMAALAILIRLKSARENRKFYALAISLWVAIGVACYATLWLPLLVALLVYAFVECVIAWRQRAWAGMRLWIGVGLVSLLLSLLPLFAQWATIIAQAGGIFGWPMGNLNNSIGALIDFDAFQTHLQIRQRFQIISWVVLVAFVACAIWFGRAMSRRKRFWMIAALFLIAAIMAVGNLAFSWGSYNSWKLMSFLFPLVLVLLYSSLIFGYGTIVRWVAGAGTAALLGVAVLFGFLHGGLSTTPDMLALKNDQRLKQIATVNVKLNPFFETMMASALVPTQRVTISGQTYVAPSATPEACTLVKAGDPLAGLAGAVELSPSFVLTPWPGKCSTNESSSPVSDPPQAFGPVSQLSERDLGMYFFSGWFSREPDGIWSAGSSWLVFPEAATDVPEVTKSVRIVFTAAPIEAQSRVTVTFTGAGFVKRVVLVHGDVSQSVTIPLTSNGRTAVNVTSSLASKDSGVFWGASKDVGIKVISIEK